MPDEQNTSTSRRKLPSKNDRGKFNDIFRTFIPRLQAYGELFIDKESARDIVQDLMVYIYDNADTIIIHSSLEAYLFKAVYLRCLNHIKHKRIQQSFNQRKADEITENDAHYYDPDENEVIRKIFSSELKTEIENAINELPQKCREAFIKSYIQEMSTRKIAEELNISERTVDSHVYTALKHLRLRLKDNFWLLIPLHLFL